GEGEERRDHVLVDDVAEIVCRVIEHRSRGTLNIATGEVYSFRDIAERIAAMAKPAVTVRGTPRQGEMPHGGYRPFDIAACRRAFPDFRYTSLADGLKEARDGGQRNASAASEPGKGSVQPPRRCEVLVAAEAGRLRRFSGPHLSETHGLQHRRLRIRPHELVFENAC